MTSAPRHRLLVGLLCIPAVLSIATAATAGPNDLVYITCKNMTGNFRISELNRSVSQFSDRYQEYRDVCRDCDVLEWGNRITMKDGAKTYIQIDRQTGKMQIQRYDAKKNPGPDDPRSFNGTCVRGNVITPKITVTQSARAF